MKENVCKQDSAITAVIEIMEKMSEDERLRVFELVCNFDVCDSDRQHHISKFAATEARMRALEIRELKNK